MTALRREPRLSLGVEVALAFGAGAASFALAAVTVVAVGSDVWFGVLGVVYGVAVVAMFRYWGVAYAVPAAVAVMLAYDWYVVPPTHSHVFPRSADLAYLLAYLLAGVLIGELAAYANRRADVSESARSELAEEQAALRRVATLVARGEPPAAVFAAVAEEVGVLLDVDGARVVRYISDDEIFQLEGWTARGNDRLPVGPLKLEGTSLSGEVLRTGRAVRIEDYASVNRAVPWFVQRLGIRSGVAAPIVLDARLWGAMLAWSLQPRLLPGDAERRLAGFTELIATAISNTASREQLAELADEQATLRRVATLVARGVPPPEVFAAVAQEVGELLDVDAIYIGRYDDDDTSTGVGSWSRAGDPVPVGIRASLDGPSVTALVFKTGRPARKENLDNAPGQIAAITRELGIRSAVGGPIVVDGRPWGVMIAASHDDEPLPGDTESRIAAFTELVATAISNTEARVEVGRLAEEQAALRRVATLVARESSATEVFAEVTQEVGLLLGAEAAWLHRYEPDGNATVVANWGEGATDLAVGTWLNLEGDSVVALVQRTGRPARIDDYTDASGSTGVLARKLGLRSAVGSPIIVGGRLWGAMTAVTRRAQPLPADAGSRIEKFTELVATAISNTEARVEVGRLAEEQAALRRVATLVARQASSTEVFTKVAEEVGRLLGAESAWMLYYEPDGDSTLVAMWGELAPAFPVGAHLSLEGENVAAQVRRTWRPARIDDYANATGALGAHAREAGVRSAVGSPIVVEGQLWGSMTAVTLGAEPLPADAESRIEEFTELVATAISNIQARSDLAASRARIVAAADEERRQVVRDLHDGAQQRLVHTVVTLKLARRALEDDSRGAPALVAEALRHAEEATAELRELAHGILPSVLTRGGLRAGVGALASRMPVPVEIGVSVDRLPLAVEATAYFIVAEALTNVAKHSHANHAEVTARVEDGTLQVQVRDDGIGGAQPDGSGLLGLGDRLAVHDGSLRVESPADGGTLIAAAIPFR